jgi:hypothetical protein
MVAAALLLAAACRPDMAGATAAAVRAGDAQPLLVEVGNPTGMQRAGEVMELPLREVWQRRPAWRDRELLAHVAGSARPLTTQRYASDGGPTADTLLVQLDMTPHASLRLALAPADGDRVAQLPRQLYARHVPERDDDFAWENLQVTYRIYGPGLQARGEVSSGIDVWSKRPPHPVIDDWYRRNAQAERRNDPALSYHVDNGVGMDSYEVGHAPGAGGTAAWVDGRPSYSKNATQVRITAMGPLRLRFEVDYAPWQAGVARVHEHKVITLDAGAHLNRQRVTYRIDGASRLTLAAGVSVHDGAAVAHDGARTVTVWDTPQNASAGPIATALVSSPQTQPRYVRQPHAAWLLFDIPDGGSFEFASGAGWSKGDMPSFDSWQRYVRDCARRWSHPLRVRWPDR